MADASIDELVALGTHAQYGKIVAEFNRVLRPGGILRLGTTTQYLNELMSIWGVRLQRLGYMELSGEQTQYDYTSSPGIPEATVSYSVVSFQKAGKSNE